MVFELTGKIPKGRLPRSLAQKGLASKRLQRKLGVEVETLDYLTWNAVILIQQNAEQLLEKAGFAVLTLSSRFPSMVTFYNENKDNKDFHIKIG